MVRAFAFHRSGLGSISASTLCGSSVFLVLYPTLVPEDFPRVVRFFPFHHKPKIDLICCDLV